MTKKKSKVKKERLYINGRWFRKKANGKPGVELVRNSFTMTEAEYFAMILSALRQTTRFWKPKLEKLEEGKRTSTLADKRVKYQYSCEACKQWFKRSEIEIDHIEPCGGVNSYEKIVPWLKKAHVETGFQRLCKSCHRAKSNKERKVTYE